MDFIVLRKFAGELSEATPLFTFRFTGVGHDEDAQGSDHGFWRREHPRGERRPNFQAQAGRSPGLGEVFRCLRFRCEPEARYISLPAQGFRAGDKVVTLTKYDGQAELVDVPAPFLVSMAAEVDEQQGVALMLLEHRGVYNCGIDLKEFSGSIPPKPQRMQDPNAGASAMNLPVSRYKRRCVSNDGGSASLSCKSRVGVSPALLAPVRLPFANVQKRLLSSTLVGTAQSAHPPYGRAALLRLNSRATNM